MFGNFDADIFLTTGTPIDTGNGEGTGCAIVCTTGWIIVFTLTPLTLWFILLARDANWLLSSLLGWIPSEL